MTMNKSPTLKTPKKLVVKEVVKPKCPKHLQDMHFDSAEGTWRCSLEECRMIARRKEETTNAPKSDVKFNISLEMISTQDESEDSYLIVASAGGQRTVIDVTDYVDMVIDENTNSVTLCLMFNQVKRVRL